MRYCAGSSTLTANSVPRTPMIAEGAHAHRLRRALHHPAGNHRERAALERGIELPVVGGAVEGVAIDRERAARAERKKAVVEEGDADGAVGAGDQDIGLPDPHAGRGREALPVALDVHRAAQVLDLPDVARWDAAANAAAARMTSQRIVTSLQVPRNADSIMRGPSPVWTMPVVSRTTMLRRASSSCTRCARSSRHLRAGRVRPGSVPAAQPAA